LFKEIGTKTQEAFFLRLAGAITNVRKALGPSLVLGFQKVAGAAGEFTRAFIELFASPVFVRFFNTLVPATTKWIRGLSTSLFGRRGFIVALLEMATALMPFMTKFGEIILRNLGTLSGLIFNLASNPATQTWLDRMAATLQMVFDLLFNVGDFLFVFMRQLDQAGGAELIRVLSEAITQLSFFFASPVGAKAMEGLINLGIIGIRTFTGLIEVVALVLAAFQYLAEWLKDTAIPAIIADIKTLGRALVDMSTFLGVWITRIISAIGGFFVSVNRLGANMRASFISFVKGVIYWIAKTLVEILNFPKRIVASFSKFGSLLVNSGRALIQGLINGIRQKIGELFNLIGGIAGRIGGFFGASPAKEGPLSGRGWTKVRGQRMIEDLIEGIRSEIPELRQVTMNAASNIVFGPNAVQVNVAGGVPDQNQARMAGSAMGQAAANMIAARNTRLAVRTL
jgi:hypothetical protein